MNDMKLTILCNDRCALQTKGNSQFMPTNGLTIYLQKIVLSYQSAIDKLTITIKHNFTDWRIYTDGGIIEQFSLLLSKWLGETVEVCWDEVSMQKKNVVAFAPSDRENSKAKLLNFMQNTIATAKSNVITQAETGDLYYATE
jgi:hypothetical protein